MLYLNDKHLTNDTTQFPENILRPNEIGNFKRNDLMFKRTNLRIKLNPKLEQKNAEVVYIYL